MKTKEEITKNRERLNAISDELFDMANSFAGDETGAIAGKLHKATNLIWDAMKMIDNGVTPEDNVQQLTEWLLENQIGLMRQ